MTASARISSEFTSKGLPPPTENGRDFPPRGTCRALCGLKAKGSLPVRLCPPVMGVKREGSGECEDGGRVSFRVTGDEGVELTTPSSGILSTTMDSELLNTPLVISVRPPIEIIIIIKLVHTNIYYLIMNYRYRIHMVLHTDTIHDKLCTIRQLYLETTFTDHIIMDDYQYYSMSNQLLDIGVITVFHEFKTQLTFAVDLKVSLKQVNLPADYLSVGLQL